MSKKSIDRRQFVRRSVAAGAAAVAATTAIGKGVKACPVFFDADGNRQTWWCIVSAVDLNPFVTVYTWENCDTGQTHESLGDPGLPLGACNNASTDPSCINYIILRQWPRRSFGGKEYLIPSEVSKETIARAEQFFANN